jgi:hypothetical protein
MSGMRDAKLDIGVQRMRSLARVPERKSVRSAPEREQAALGFDGADEAFEQLANVLLDAELLRGWQQLDDEIEEALGELGMEAIPGQVPADVVCMDGGGRNGGRNGNLGGQRRGLEHAMDVGGGHHGRAG